MAKRTSSFIAKMVRNSERTNYNKNGMHQKQEESDRPDTRRDVAPLNGLFRLLLRRGWIPTHVHLLHIVFQHARVYSGETRAKSAIAAAKTAEPPDEANADPVKRAKYTSQKGVAHTHRHTHSVTYTVSQRERERERNAGTPNNTYA